MFVDQTVTKKIRRASIAGRLCGFAESKISSTGASGDDTAQTRTLHKIEVRAG
jgi:hypothetical protein